MYSTAIVRRALQPVEAARAGSIPSQSTRPFFLSWLRPTWPENRTRLAAFTTLLALLIAFPSPCAPALSCQAPNTTHPIHQPFSAFGCSHIPAATHTNTTKHLHRLTNAVPGTIHRPTASSCGTLFTPHFTHAPNSPHSPFTPHRNNTSCPSHGLPASQLANTTLHTHHHHQQPPAAHSTAQHLTIHSTHLHFTPPVPPQVPLSPYPLTTPRVDGTGLNRMPHKGFTTSYNNIQHQLNNIQNHSNITQYPLNITQIQLKNSDTHPHWSSDERRPSSSFRRRHSQQEQSRVRHHGEEAPRHGGPHVELPPGRPQGQQQEVHK